MVGGIRIEEQRDRYAATHGVIEFCVNYGTVSGGATNSYIGGIIGNAVYGIGVQYCGNEGVISGNETISTARRLRRSTRWWRLTSRCSATRICMIICKSCCARRRFRLAYDTRNDYL